MGAQMADLRSHTQSRSGLFSLFRPVLVCLSPNDREEGSTARWVNPESPLRPAVALPFVVGGVGGDQSPKAFVAHTFFVEVRVDGHHERRLAPVGKPTWSPRAQGLRLATQIIDFDPS